MEFIWNLVLGTWNLNMTVNILISGFGGQGLMSLGKLLATCAIREGKSATYFPSYGAEVRGGTAYCFVKISDERIASPLVETSDVAMLLNQQSIELFKKIFNKNCFFVLNADLIKDKSQISKGKIVYLPLNKIALDCGNIKCANVVALGVLIKQMPNLLKQSTIIEFLKEVFHNNKELIEQNIKALYEGEKHGKS